jgi:glycosyltransferase involved in cell wall biosynthesis
MAGIDPSTNGRFSDVHRGGRPRTHPLALDRRSAYRVHVIFRPGMNIALIGHGNMPIPPSGWGAVEAIIWQLKLHLERLGHAVVVFNIRNIHKVIHILNEQPFDFVHCHNEVFAAHCNAHLRQPYVITNHSGGMHRILSGGGIYGAFEYMLRDCFQAPGNFVLSEETAAFFRRRGYQGFLRVVRNGVECSEFRVAEKGNGRAVCVGLIQGRKRQAWLAEAVRGRVAVDFVGPWNPQAVPAFKENENARYLGAWDRETLHAKLTDYSCLVILSESEACAPKVVLEALAAGLNVVITDACAATLTPQDFITVLPTDGLDPDLVEQSINVAIESNRRLRPEIRQYALERFDYPKVTVDYLRAIEDFRRHCNES